MADPLYFVNGPDTEEQRQYAQTKLKSQGCSYVVHEQRGDGVICSLGYTKHVPDSICLIVNHRTPVYAE